MESIFNLGILLRVKDMVSGPVRNMNRTMDTLKGKVHSLGPAFEKFRDYGKWVAIGGAAMVGLLGTTVMATAGTQKALRELSSVGITNLAALEAAGTSFSNKWSGTTKAQFISAAYDIKSGISSLSDEGVAEFTRLAALTGKAVKSTTAEMTSLFATGYGIYKQMYAGLSDMQFGKLFSGGIAASVKQFKTTGSGMAQAISTLGATATTAKVPLQEQLTILGMLQATMSGSEAGTKYRALIQSAAGAGKKLKLSFLDANNQLLSMPAILGKLKGKYGSTLDAMEKMQIQKAFGTQEAVAVIDLLYGKVGALTKNIKNMSSMMKQGTNITQQMASAMNMDIGSGIALLHQRFHNLMEVIGKQLIPILTPLFTMIGNLITRFTQFAGKHKHLTQVMVIGTGALAVLIFTLGALATALGVVGLMTPNIIKGFGDLKFATSSLKTRIFGAIGATKAWIVAQYKSLTAAIANAGGIRAYAMSLGSSFLTSMGAAITAVWSFTTALLANPITWVVIGIVALGGALYLLYKKFAVVRTAVNGFLFVLGYILGVCVRVGKGFLTALLHPIIFIKSLFWGAGQVITWLIGKFSSISPALKNVAKVILSFVFPPLAIFFYWGNIKKGVSAMLNWVTGLFSKFEQAGKALWGAFVSGIKSMLMKPVELVKKGLSYVRNLLPFSDAKEGPLSKLTLSGSRLMETLAGGVKASAPVLKNAVATALAGVIIASPAVAGPDTSKNLVKPVQTAIIQNTAVEPPVIPNLSAQAAWQAKQPVSPAISDLSATAGWQTLKPAVPSIPNLSARAMWETKAVKPPVIPNLTSQAMWKTKAVKPPVIPNLTREISLKTKGGLEVGKSKNVLAAEKPSSASSGKKVVNNIHIHNITLPNVSSAEDLLEQLKRLTEGYDA